jgi:hypothetical protein
VYLSLFLTRGLAAQAPPQNPAEMATREEPATFEARVNLVLVPVVVRDRVIGNRKRIEMCLRDDTLENRLGSGIAVRTSLDVKPGSYMIRRVVRDDEGQLMAAENGAVKIP